MPILKYYIIQDHSSNTWLPVAKQRNRTSANFTSKEPPRLFTKKYAATQALNWWKEGIHYMKYCGATWASPEEYNLDNYPRTYTQAIDPKVVEVTLEVPDAHS